jgi:hypothetical protein
MKTNYNNKSESKVKLNEGGRGGCKVITKGSCPNGPNTEQFLKYAP